MSPLQPPPRKLTTPSPSDRLRNSSLNTICLRRIFDLFDCDSDGLITPSELSDALNRLGISANPDEMSSIFSPSDSPGLDFPAFQALHRSLGDALIGISGEDGPHQEVEAEEEAEAKEEEDMVKAFKVFDEDGDGFISAVELQAVLKKIGMEEEGRSLEKVKVMIGSMDCNKDGRVDFYEFKNMLRSVVIVQG